MFKLLAILGIFCVSSSMGQTFENIRSQKDEDKIIIVYDLVSIDPGSRVTVRIFSSLDDYKLPLKNVTGDVGIVLPGPNKRIIWQVDTTISNDYQGIVFKFESESSAGWRVISPAASGISRGKENTIQWQGGRDNDEIIIQLLKPDSEVEEIARTKNTGSFKWNTPKTLKPGKSYVLVITSHDTSIEHRFTIKRRIPLGYYAIPGGLGILMIALLGGDSGSDDLPDAPLPN
jgi:Ser-Thr-rich glycosyl-phosphatidyl-inositol-anchored membrane family